MRWSTRCQTFSTTSGSSCLVMYTTVPSPFMELTLNSSIKVCIMVKPMPERSSPGSVVKNGRTAFSMSSMPLPVSLTLICSDLSSISHSTVIMPRLPLYACTVQFVTASDTAVLMSESTASEGLRSTQNAATASRANTTMLRVL